MANTARLRGAWPIGEPLRTGIYLAGGTVYPGDFVQPDSAGKVAVGAAAVALLGVAKHKATVGQEIAVWDHPDQRFGVASSSTDIDAQTDINQNYDILATAADTTYNRSKHSLNSASGNTTATLQLKLVAIEPRVDNALGTGVDCEVYINNHIMKGGTGTLGL